MLGVLEDGVSDPDICDYIFQEEPELSAEEIAEKALSYKPICL